MIHPLVIVDYGMGNLGSISNMLRRIGTDAEISSNPATIGTASKLILPGVGAFDNAMDRLEGLGLRDVLTRRVMLDRVPVLGLCLGMQLFANRSEEGSRPGFGWIPGDVVRFDFQRAGVSPLKVPHMGWNEVQVERKNPLIQVANEWPRYYFVHSFHVVCANPSDVIGTATYGYRFPAAVMRNNIIGMQCHPEKSHAFGMQVMRNFVEWFPC